MGNLRVISGWSPACGSAFLLADRSNRRPTVGRAPEGGLGPGEAAGYGGEGGGVYGIWVWRPPTQPLCTACVSLCKIHHNDVIQARNPGMSEVELTLSSFLCASNTLSKSLKSHVNTQVKARQFAESNKIKITYFFGFAKQKNTIHTVPTQSQIYHYPVPGGSFASKLRYAPTPVYSTPPPPQPSHVIYKCARAPRRPRALSTDAESSSPAPPQPHPPTRPTPRPPAAGVLGLVRVRP